MQIRFGGKIPIEDLKTVLASVIEMLQREGIECVSELSLSFLGWRGDARCQIVNDEGRVLALGLDATPNILDPNIELVLPPQISIRDRPDDPDLNPFSVIFGDLFDR